MTYSHASIPELNEHFNIFSQFISIYKYFTNKNNNK